MLEKGFSTLISTLPEGSYQQRRVKALEVTVFDTLKVIGVEDPPDAPKPTMYSINGGRIIYDSRNGSFSLIDKEGKIVGGGQLTSTEQRFLGLLIRNQGDIVDNQTILNEVWGPDSFTPGSIIRKNVHRLRRKLEPGIADARHNSIFQNVGGIGYKLVVSVDIVDKTPS